MIEDLLEEGIAVPVKKWHVEVSCIEPLCPLCAVDDLDELYQKLTEDGWRTVSSGYCHDDQIHVHTKAGKVDNRYHGADLSDGSLCLRLVHVKNIHALLHVGNHVTHTYLLDNACIPLRKKGQWVDGVCFVVEGSDSVGGKVSTLHVGGQDFTNHLDGEVLGPDAEVVLFLGHQQGLTNQVGQRGGTGNPWVAKDYFHAIGWGCKGHATDGQLLEVDLRTHMEEHELYDPFFGFGFHQVCRVAGT